MNPLISVIIPARDREAYIREALDSALEQTGAPTLEIIVVDDGSIDETVAVAESYGTPVRVLRQPPSGIAAARNAGVNAAQGDFIAFLDSDDYWTRDKLSLQLAAFAQSPAPDMVFGHVRQFISPDIPEAERAALRCPPGAMPGYHAGTMLIWRETLLKVGYFADSEQLGNEFLDWYLRAFELGLRTQMLPDVVMWRRLHLSNFRRGQPDLAAAYTRVLKASLDRRRSGKQ